MTGSTLDSEQIGAPFSVRLTWSKDCAILALAGELDMLAVGQVNDAAREVLLRPERMVRLDLGRLTFCDCAGGRALSSLCQQLAEENRQVQVDGIQRMVRRVLDLLSVTLPSVPASGNSD